jgi:phosphoribosylanthranilate isomerase
VKVKVCGLTCYEDAALALDEAVDALGFNFFQRSPRYIKPEEAGAIIRRLPPFVATVGVFVNVANPDDVMGAARCAGVQILQLHGDEPPEYCLRLSGWTLIKALRIGEEGVRNSLTGYPVHAFLLDAKDDARFGGTGKTFDWGRAEGIKMVRPVILAGGLHAGNVGEAIRTVQPYGVDVCSGVESKPGKKDPGRLRAFMREVRHVIGQS